MERASSMASIRTCASSTWRRWIISSSSLLERIASIREGSSWITNVRLIKCPHAKVLRFRKKNKGGISIPEPARVMRRTYHSQAQSRLSRRGASVSTVCLPSQRARDNLRMGGLVDQYSEVFGPSQGGEWESRRKSMLTSAICAPSERIGRFA